MQLSKPIHVIIGTILSGLCWYLSCGLNGDYWWLTWLAPIPILLICFQLSSGKAFFAAFIAYLIGRLSWLSYLLSVVPIMLVIIFTLLSCLIFALTVSITRKMVLQAKHWAVAFVYPVCFVSFEFIFFLLSRDGTFASIAYSQSNCLPIIQLASITGILGITFLVSFFASAIAVVVHYRENKKIVKYLLVGVPALVLLVFLFGVLRLAGHPSAREINIGLAVIERKIHFQKDHTKTEIVASIIRSYIGEISKLSKQGADVVVLPEKIITLSADNDSALTRLLTNAAIQNHVSIVIGCERDSGQDKANIALVISPEGMLLSDYRKVNLFEGELLDGVTPGKNIGLFNLVGLPSGVAICKDLDFDRYMRKYAKKDIEMLYVPAWDFMKDDWLHSRMAILRSVEGGYAMARNALSGCLTINDYRGKVLYEGNCSNGHATTLLGKVQPEPVTTFYGLTGNWFGVINLFAFFYILLFVFQYKKR